MSPRRYARRGSHQGPGLEAGPEGAGRWAARCGDAGFTLIEVMISLGILALSLGVLLQAQASSLHAADRARNITIASLLARSKMIDIEQMLFDEGFTVGEVNEEGDFEEEGHSEYKWAYRVAEIELDLSGLSSLCAGFGGGEEEESASDCESMLASFGGPFESLTEEIGRSLRLVVLTVTWPDGKYSESMSVRALVTREDFNLVPPGAAGAADGSSPAGILDGGVNPFGPQVPGKSQATPRRK